MGVAHEVCADDLFNDGVVSSMILSLCISLVSLSNTLGSCGIIQVGQVLIFRILILRTTRADGSVRFLSVGRNIGFCIVRDIYGLVLDTTHIGVVGKPHSLPLQSFSNSSDVTGMPHFTHTIAPRTRDSILGLWFFFFFISS